MIQSIEAFKRSIQTKHSNEQCHFLFFDLGSNIGVTVRKLFEPEKYPNAAILPTFDKLFGAADIRNNNVCVYGFEVNPENEPRLKRIEECYKRQGWQLEFIMKAVSNRDDDVVTVRRKGKGDVGANVQGRVRPNIPNEAVAKVSTVDIARFIKEKADLHQPKAVLVKMDIEGSEYEVLPHLLKENMLCNEYVTKMTIEFHGHKFDTSAAAKEKGLDTTLDMQWLNNKLTEQKCSSTIVLNGDDESYNKDGKDLPDDCHPQQ